MKLNNIHIDGFGVWFDRTWGPLSGGVNVFYGPNETGKSTLMAFIRSMLFGFEKRGAVRRYEPLKGGAHGGWLDLESNDKPFRVERKPGRHVRGAVSVYEGDVTGGEEVLDRLLGGTTKTLYHNVFAFGLEELQQFQTLQENEIAQHISGAGLGIGAARWASVQKDLDERQSALFLPRGQTSVINVALKELEGVRDELDRTEHQPEEYWAAHELKSRLAAEIAGLQDAVSDLKQRVGYYEKRLKSRPAWERHRKIEAQLIEMPVVDRFPEGGVERLELLRKQLHGLQSQVEQLAHDREFRKMRRVELTQMTDPEEQARRGQVIDALRNLAPRAEAIRRVYGSAVERRNAVQQEKETLDSTFAKLQPPALSSFVAFLALIWLGALGIAAAGYEYAAAAAIVVTLVPILWYRSRVRAIRGIITQLKSCVARLNASSLELREVEAEGRELESEVRRLTGKEEIGQTDIDERVAEMERTAKVLDDIRRLDEDSDRCALEMERIQNQKSEVQAAILALLEEGAASTEAQFFERAVIFKQRLQLLSELEKTPSEPPESGLLFNVRVNDEEAYELAQQELGDVEQRLIEARHESGRVEERIAGMERSEERSRALARQEVIQARIDGAAELWAVLTLCRTLLDETRKVYESDRQPEVVRQASFFFNLMTEGAYARVIAPLDGGDLQVERSDGVRLAPYVLSRGAAEQLYLAMRLALIREYAQHIDPLPVVFDDVFVNFDPKRTRHTIQAVGRLAMTHQVLVFTCHPHIVEYFQEIVPTAKLFPLQ